MSAERFVHNVSPDHDKTEKDHFYPTPPEATKSLLALETFGPLIWEPACGTGAISRVLEAAGNVVISDDLVDRGYGEARRDFLLETKLQAPEIITNPPFKLAERFVEHALSLGADKVAMLLRLAWLEGLTRKALFERTSLTRVHVSSRRLTMVRGGDESLAGGGGMIAFAWFIWNRREEGLPVEIRFFDWMDHAPECAKEKQKATAEPMPLFE